jgi:hypothetical protein
VPCALCTIRMTAEATCLIMPYGTHTWGPETELHAAQGCIACILAKDSDGHAKLMLEKAGKHCMSAFLTRATGLSKSHVAAQASRASQLAHNGTVLTRGTMAKDGHKETTDLAEKAGKYTC